MKKFFLIGLTLLFLLVAPIALADQPKEPYGDGEVPPGKKMQPRPPTIEEDEGGLLPFTGADLTLFVATGVAAVATGVIVLRRTRPRDDDGRPVLVRSRVTEAKESVRTSAE